MSGVPVGDTTLLQRLTEAHEALLEANRRVTQKNLGRQDYWLNGVEDLLDTAALGWPNDEDLVTLIEAAQRIEWCWDGMYDRCPDCGMVEAAGHDRSCRLSAALAPFVGEATQ